MSYAITHRSIEGFDTERWFPRTYELAHELYPDDMFSSRYGVQTMFGIMHVACTVAKGEPSGLREGFEVKELPEGLANDQVEDFLVGATVKAVLAIHAEVAGVRG